MGVAERFDRQRSGSSSTALALHRLALRVRWRSILMLHMAVCRRSWQQGARFSKRGCGSDRWAGCGHASTKDALLLLFAPLVVPERMKHTALD